MNRRDLLKRLAGIPLLGALVPAAAVTFKGMDLASGPDSTSLNFISNGCVAPADLTEQSLEDMLKQITAATDLHSRPLRINPTQEPTAARA